MFDLQIDERTAAMIMMVFTPARVPERLASF